MNPIDLSDVDAATGLLIERTSMVGDELTTQPSRLPDWTVGHVLAHIALNGEAFVLVAEARRRGELGVMYPHGAEGRNRDIAELAAAPAATILDRLAKSAAAFRAAWSDAVPEGPCTPAVGRPEFPASSGRLRRLREVEVHGVDIGHDLIVPADWSDRYVETDLALQWEGVADRLPSGVGVAVTDGVGSRWSAGAEAGEIVEADLTRPELLAWIVDRLVVDRLPALTPWG